MMIGLLYTKLPYFYRLFNICDLKNKSIILFPALDFLFLTPISRGKIKIKMSGLIDAFEKQPVCWIEARVKADCATASHVV